MLTSAAVSAFYQCSIDLLNALGLIRFPFTRSKTKSDVFGAHAYVVPSLIQ